MSLTLKTYQQQALETLDRFFRAYRSQGAERAYGDILTATGVAHPPGYVDVFGGAPAVCLRIPTGGGKTLLGAYVAATAGKQLVDTNAPVTLWLTPTDTIFKQTFQALNTAGHPYRAALDTLFPQGVRVCTLENLQTIARQEIGRMAVVIVATIQSFRIEDTSQRNVYAFFEELAPHFDGLSGALEEELDKVTEADIAKQPYLTTEDIGRVKHSVANWLALHRPVVIVDEAHNARTENTFNSLKRLRPACVVELTATPVTGSNVLYHVSAQELKAADMIKLPIVLYEHPTDWKDAVDAAIQRRTHLDTLAQSERDYIRPIVLFQAQPKNGDVTVEVLHNHLVTVEQIPEDQIAVVTGSQKELDGIDLFDPQCPIRFVITIEALKEGWDCSFAYILCSLQEVRSAKDVEQLLGRVLRMPYAKTRQNPELNRAYAHVVAASFSEAVNALTDKMVQNMGFEAYDLATSFVPPQLPLFETEDGEDSRQTPLIQTFDVILASTPVIDHLPQEVRERVEFRETTQGTAVTVRDEVPEDLLDALVAAATKDKQAGIRQDAAYHNARVQAYTSPASRGHRLAPVPQLCLELDGDWQVVDGAVLAEIGEWSLLAAPIGLAGFSLRETAQGWEIDVEGAKVKYSLLNRQEQLALDYTPTAITEQGIVLWLNPEVRQPDISHPDLTSYLTQTVNHLIRDRSMPLAGLWRCKQQLANEIVKDIDRKRKLAQEKGFQLFLLKMAIVQNEGNYQHAWTPPPEIFYPRRQPVFSGSYRFQKDFYGHIPDLKNAGEEFECAKAIDTNPSVNLWMRNLDRDPHAFKFQTATDYFYPDFYCELKDGRGLFVEYKGEPYKTNDDSREKNQIGYQWEKTGEGKWLYMMAVKEDEKGRGVAKQIEDKIAGVL